MIRYKVNLILNNFFHFKAPIPARIYSWPIVGKRIRINSVSANAHKKKTRKKNNNQIFSIHNIHIHSHFNAAEPTLKHIFYGFMFLKMLGSRTYIYAVYVPLSVLNLILYIYALNIRCILYGVALLDIMNFNFF